MFKLDYISDLLRLLVRLVIVIFDFMVRFFDIDIGVFLLEKVGIVFEFVIGILFVIVIK